MILKGSTEYFPTGCGELGQRHVGKVMVPGEHMVKCEVRETL